METKSLYLEMKVMNDCVPMMERKVLKKAVNWKKRIK